MEFITADEIRARAADDYWDENIEFDFGAALSVGSDGTWVQAWVFVPDVQPTDYDED